MLEDAVPIEGSSNGIRSLLTRSLVMFLGFSALRMVGAAMVNTFLVLYLVDVRNVSLAYASFILSSTMLTGFISAPLGGYVASRVGEKRWLVIAQALEKAQSDDPKALQKALVGNTFQDWSGEVKFEEPQGLKWHNVSPPHLILQQTEVRQPFTESKLVFPSQFGGDGKIAGP